MPLSWKSIAIPSAGVLLLAGAVALLTPSPAAAQCGSQTSSCQNCHEVQAQMPVNAVGDWHVSHAFGDFCQFCHAGNVQATEADQAHQGMVAPLADPVASCGACHPTDIQPLAQVYGTALGVEIGSVAGAAPVEAPGAAATPTESTPASAGLPAGPASIDTIDYNALYDETAEGKLNTGNLVLGGLIALAVVGGGGYVLWNERRRRRGRAQSAAPVTLSVAEATSPDGSPEQAEMLLAIAALDPLGRRSLGQLLRDPATASDLLRRLARLDPEVVRTVRGLDRETRALLLALTSD
jgi:hypothetical protein